MKSRRPRKARPAAPRAIVIVPVFFLAGLAVPGAMPANASEVLNGDRTLTGIVDDALGGGYLVQNGTLTINNATVSNFITQGGTGLGGGAGLGGTVFINSGAAPVLNNVTVSGNAAIGGTGGSGLYFVDNVVLLGDGNGNGVAGANGSDGWATQPKLIDDVSQATIAEVLAISALAATTAQAIPDPAGIAQAQAVLVAAAAPASAARSSCAMPAARPSPAIPSSAATPCRPAEPEWRCGG